MGTLDTFKLLDSPLFISDDEFVGFQHINKFGNNPDIDANVYEDIWDAGGTYVFPTEARIHDITSTDTNDTSGGTGARTINIQGLDANYNEIEEDVTLNGTTNVPTTKSFLRIHRMKVTSAGSGGEAVGNITATAQTDATVSAQITNRRNQTLMAIYTVPAGKTGYITNIFSSVGRKATTALEVELYVRPFGEVFQIKMLLSGHSQGSSHIQHMNNPYIKITEKSDIKLKATVTTNNSNISGGFDIILIDN